MNNFLTKKKLIIRWQGSKEFESDYDAVAKLEHEKMNKKLEAINGDDASTNWYGMRHLGSENIN